MEREEEQEVGKMISMLQTNQTSEITGKADRKMLEMVTIGVAAIVLSPKLPFLIKELHDIMLALFHSPSSSSACPPLAP